MWRVYSPNREGNVPRTSLAGLRDGGYARLSGLACKFVEGAVHAAGARGSALLWASMRCSRLSRSVRVNFQLNGLAMAL
jgi:hypothetical protein